MISRDYTPYWFFLQNIEALPFNEKTTICYEDPISLKLLGPISANLAHSRINLTIQFESNGLKFFYFSESSRYFIGLKEC